MEIKRFDNIGETLYSETLENGLTVYVALKPGYSRSYAFFATNYGGADRRFLLGGDWIDTPAGVAHFLEHKMFDTPDGDNALNVLSSNGASPNAYTSNGVTAYYFDCTEGFEENLRTLLSFVSVPYFTAESVSKEQGIIGQEIRMIEDSPGHVVYQNLMKCLYAQNPVRDSVAGTVESISEITEKTLYDCHRVFYNPSNMALCVAGDVDPGRVIEIAREILPGQAGDVPQRDYGKEEILSPVKSRAVAEMEVSAPQFLIGAKVKPERGGDARIFQSLVGNLALRCLLGPSSPLYTRLYADGLLNSDFDYGLDYSADTATVIFGGESRDPEAVMEELAAQVRRIADARLDAGLFERVKKAEYGDRLRSLGYFSALCAELAEGRFAQYDYLESFEILERVSREDVEAFIRQVFAPDCSAMSVVNPSA